MRSCLLLPLFGLGHAQFNFDVTKIKQAAEIILVKGLHTSQPGDGWLSAVDKVMQGLNVEIDTPYVPTFPANGATVDSCSREWHCQPKKFWLCPGQQLNSVEAYNQPKFSWSVDPTFYYSVLLVDFFSPDHAKLAGRAANTIAAKVNWGVLNMHGTSDLALGTKLNTKLNPHGSDWDRPKNPFITQSWFAYLLFVHGSPIQNSWINSARTYRDTDPTKVDLSKFIGIMGLTGEHLSGFNFFRMSASAFTHSSGEVAKDPNLCSHLLAGKPATGKLDMCDSVIDTTCASWCPILTTASTTPEPSVTFPPAEGSSPTDEIAARLEGRLKAQVALQRLNGKLGRLSDDASWSRKDYAFAAVGAAVGASLAGVAIVGFSRKVRNVPSEDVALLDE